MQVGESKLMCIVDDDGVGVGNIYSVLDNSRREQHVIVVVDKSQYDILKLLRRHLPVPDGNAAVRDIFQNKPFYLRQRRYAVVDKEHLSVAAHLEVYGIGNHLMSVCGELGIYWMAVGRRRAHDAHVSRSHKRELQRPRYRGCRHGESVYV